MVQTLYQNPVNCFCLGALVGLVGTALMLPLGAARERKWSTKSAVKRGALGGALV